MDNGTIALTGAAVLMLLYTFKGNAEERDDKVRNALAAVDWTTIFFFIGLFVMVYGLEVTGILSYLGHEFIEMTNGSMGLVAGCLLRRKRHAYRRVGECRCGRFGYAGRSSD